MPNKILSKFEINDKEIEIVSGDITKIHSDVIVSSDDNYISMGGGVSKAIKIASKDVAYDESRKFVPAVLGDVVVTNAGKLKSDYVFHAIVIDYDKWKFPDIDIIKNVTKQCILKADELGCQSISLPAFGTGAGYLGFENCANGVIEAIFSEYSKLKILKNIKIVLLNDEILLSFYKIIIEQRLRIEYEEKIKKLQKDNNTLINEINKKSEFQNIPFPIVTTRRLIDTQSKNQMKFTSTIDAGESIIKFLGSIIFSFYLRETNNREEFYNEFNKPMTDGTWCYLIEKYIALITSSSPLFIIISNIFLKNKGYIKSIIKIRNEEHGHGSTVDDPFYLKPYNAVFKEYEKLFNGIKEIESCNFFYLDDIDFHEISFKYKIKKIVGETTFYNNEYIISDHRLNRNKLYFSDKDFVEILPLNPFMTYSPCDKCNNMDTFFIEHIVLGEKQKQKYHSYRGNHRIEIFL